MSTKTIALDSGVYDRLVAAKKEEESLSDAIDRLLAQVGAAHTGRDILRGLETIAPLSERDSDVFLEIVAENRTSEDWNQRDLR